MELLTSKKFRLPEIFFVTDKEEIKEIPMGVPFIFGDKENKTYLIRILEYEVLYQEAMRSGYPFNFKKILRDNGYRDLESWYYSNPVYMDYATKGTVDTDTFEDTYVKKSLKESSKLKQFIKDSAAYVDIQKLKALNVFPIWLDKVEKAIHTNLHNFAVFNNNMYNKKLEGMYGSLDLISPDKNLIIIDISGSIPKAVSSTALAMSKNMAETFYADILITGSKSTLYEYENLNALNINTIYDENGMDNDQTYFKNLVTSNKKVYKTIIVFGDNHSPSYPWSNNYNKGNKTISREKGIEICLWEVDKLISFHTSGTDNTAGYADWFEPKEVEKIEDWVKYLK